MISSTREKGIAMQKEIVLKSGSIIKGNAISKITSNQPQLAEVLTNPKAWELGLKNRSALEGFFKDANDVKLQKVPPSSVVTLKCGRVIAFKRGEVQVTVE